MYFKQLEIIGFKSFADRTLVQLEQGMTSVVGPNGCGKSNILDAMRWALGEQSPKALRGSHMQDVIFNGSEERAPTGMAEVSLTFDNSDSQLPLDFSEVQVTRRVFRSGESEYFINKAPCRLRDIQELFMDTGIGTNAYSMIGQGRISQVLSSKPEDRRALFEEAAGIIKYKSRKRVAMRKLDQAEQNLLRLGDIIAEVERQSRSLKRQVNAAIRYRDLSEQLKSLEIRAAWLQHQTLSQRIGDLRSHFEEAANSYEKTNAELSGLEARYEALNLRKLEVDRTLHARREGVHEIDSEMEKIERQIALIRQQIEFSEGQRVQADEDRIALIARAEALESESKETALRRGDLNAQRNDAETAVKEKWAAQEAASKVCSTSEAALEAVRAKAVEAMSMRAKTQTAIETLTVGIDNVERQLAVIYERQDTGAKRIEELTKKTVARRAEEREKGSALAGLQLALEEAGRGEAELNEKVNAVNETWRTLRETKSSVHARVTSLRELRDSYEGFAAGVKAIMKARKNETGETEGVLGPVGDLISTEKTFERAVESLLGGAINHVIIERAEAAKRAIDFLKANHAGRVTFLPLDLMRPRGRDDLEGVRGREGVLGPAIEFVQYEATIEKAIAYLFHNTVIVESIDVALRIAKDLDRFPRLVTLEGEVVASSGAITGGRTRHDSRGLLGRSAEIAELEERLQDVDRAISESLEKGRQVAEALENAKTRIGRLAESEQSAREALSALSVELVRLTTELDALMKTAETLNRERVQLSSRREELDRERREALENASAMESEDERLQRGIAEAQDAAAHARKTLSMLSGELSDLRLGAAGLAQTLEEAKRECGRLEQERETVGAEIEKRARAIVEFEENRELLDRDISDQVERSKAFSESKEEARAKVIEAENERESLLNQSDTLEKGIKAARDTTRETQSAVHQLEIDLRHDEDQLGFFQERIQTEYGLALGSLTAEEIGEDKYKDEERERLVSETRTKLDRMGAVNLMAIEEYEALCERNDFLVEQNDDLQTARDTLLAVIARIDQTIKDMFLDVFRLVSDHFRNNFRRLFNGGHARIYLLDEDDPLECGIEIEARPPGKKLQTLTLLSGGEQAMTAIALLFSLFSARPSPFCILDEVDAPLDDANIGRFLDMVDDFSGSTQFVVITHNKQTMARAEALYGVTMQERGVSQLVSVKFDEVRVSAEPAA